MEQDNRLMTFIERIERVNLEIAELQADVREIFSEAKGNGYSVKAIREILKLRKMTEADRVENEFLRCEYKKKAGLED
jgi:uncharacterized protein (UPF0335 family)